MEKVRIGDVNSRRGPADVKRPLTDALGATDLSINYFELDPGDSFAFGYHMHGNQEELFYVQSGTATFETADGPVDVAAGEVIRFAPGEYQRGTNEGNEPVVALAIGAPQETGAFDLRWDCPDCGERTANRIERTDGGDLVTRCEQCGAVTQQFD